MPCEANCKNGWLLADNSDHGLRIERCDSCKRFLSDAEAVTYVAVLAMGRSETDAVIESSKFRDDCGECHKPGPCALLSSIVGGKDA
jgi:hypothetical protein